MAGLSLGSMLALAQIEKEVPHLKGLILSSAQYKLKGSWAYRLQLAIFKIMPKFFLQKQGMDKAKLLSFYQSLADFDMTAAIRTFDRPVCLVCGQRDRANLSASLQLAELFPRAQLAILDGGGHQLNRDKPQELASIIKEFMETF